MTSQICDLKSVDNVRPLVVVVDDNASVREAISELLNTIGITVKLFSSAQVLLKQLEDSSYGEIENANCLILDVRMPGLGGLELQHRLRAAHFNVPIIFLSGYGDVRMTVKAMRAGAFDFLSKPFHSQDMLDTVEAAIEYDHRRREIDRRQKDLLVRYSSLTLRERNILALVARGLMNKQIAGELSLSEITIKANRSHLMRKMKARSVAELVRMESHLNDLISTREDYATSSKSHLIINNPALSSQTRSGYS